MNTLQALSTIFVLVTSAAGAVFGHDLGLPFDPFGSHKADSSDCGSGAGAGAGTGDGNETSDNSTDNSTADDGNETADGNSTADGNTTADGGAGADCGSEGDGNQTAGDGNETADDKGNQTADDDGNETADDDADEEAAPSCFVAVDDWGNDLAGGHHEWEWLVTPGTQSVGVSFQGYGGLPTGLTSHSGARLIDGAGRTIASSQGGDSHIDAYLQSSSDMLAPGSWRLVYDSSDALSDYYLEVGLNCDQPSEG